MRDLGLIIELPHRDRSVVASRINGREGRCRSLLLGCCHVRNSLPPRFMGLAGYKASPAERQGNALSTIVHNALKLTGGEPIIRVTVQDSCGLCAALVAPSPAPEESMARKPKKPQTPTGSASKATGWRSILKVHPAAETFPRMSPEEVDRLGQDIRQHGMQSPIALFCSDPRRDPRLGEVQLLDGISRLDALESVGYRLVSMGLGILNIEWAG